MAIAEATGHGIFESSKSSSRYMSCQVRLQATPTEQAPERESEFVYAADFPNPVRCCAAGVIRPR